MNLSDEETEALEEVGTQLSSHKKEPVPDVEPGSLVPGSTASHELQSKPKGEALNSPKRVKLTGIVHHVKQGWRDW